jgi:glutaredoxin
MLEVYPELSKNYEMGGKFTFPYNNGTIQRKTSRKVHKSKGNRDSVTSPNGILNFHTHPISCYLQEKTVWGWCSGEDIRETVIFGLKGTLAHAVLAIEGCYLLQISNCAIKYLIDIRTNRIPNSKLMKHYCDAIESRNGDSNKYISNFGISKDKIITGIENGDQRIINQAYSDILRGIIIALIEIYFRSSHRFRTYSFNKKKKVSPYDFLKMVDSFKIKNIFSNKKSVSGCGNIIKCSGIPVGNNKISSFKTYVKDYEHETGFYICDRSGNVISVDVSVQEIFDILPVIEEVTHHLDNCKEWFHVSLTENMILMNGNYIPYVKLSPDTQHQALEYYNTNYETFISKNIYPLVPVSDAKFYWFSIRGDCSHKDIHKHRQFGNSGEISEGLGSMFGNGNFIIGSPVCSYTRKADELLRSKRIPFIRVYYPTISEALSLSKTETVPAVYIRGKYIGGFDNLTKMFGT